jgi:hypothetical protein
VRWSAAELFADAIRLHQPIFPLSDDEHIDHPDVRLADEIDSLIHGLPFAYAEASFGRMHSASSWQPTQRGPPRRRRCTPGRRCSDIGVVVAKFGVA